MITYQEFHQLALSFAQTEEQPHFENTSFRVKKKIFATYNKNTDLICIKLSLQDQDLFSLIDKTVIFPVPNKWGKAGWTNVKLSKVKKQVLKDMLIAGYELVTSKKTK